MTHKKLKRLKIQRVMPVLLQTVIYWTSLVLFKIFADFKVEGLENLSTLKGPIIFAANHSSEWDGPLLRVALPFFKKQFSPMYYVAMTKDKYTDSGWRKAIYGGTFFNMLGAYPVYSGKRNYSYSLQNHIEIIKKGRILCIFPEGGRTKDGSFGKAHGGVAYLSHATKAPVVPVALLGLVKWNIRDFLLRRRKVRIVFGTPLRPKDLFTRNGGMSSGGYTTPSSGLASGQNNNTSFNSHPTVAEYKKAAQEVVDKIFKLYSMRDRRPKFVFLVHPRNFHDLFLRFPFLKIFPKAIVKKVTEKMGPIKVSRISGLKDKEGNDIPGMMVAIALTAKQMTENRQLALQKIVEATKYAKKLGAKVVGLGALTASFSKGGLDLVDQVENIGVTTGRAYTVKTVTDYVKAIIRDLDMDKTRLKLAVVGAAGSIGSGCALVLAKYGIKNFLLIDLDRKLDTVKENIKHISKNSEDPNNLVVTIDHQINIIKSADIIITATSAPEVVVKTDDVKAGAIIVNDAQPSDVDPNLIKERKDILVIEGGIISTPGIKVNFNMGLVSREDNFCCLGELMILAYNKHNTHYSIGILNESLIEHIDNLSKGLSFSISKYQNSLGLIPKEQIEYVKSIIKNGHN